jgi:hypothetical protein
MIEKNGKHQPCSLSAPGTPAAKPMVFWQFRIPFSVLLMGAMVNLDCQLDWIEKHLGDR